MKQIMLFLVIFLVVYLFYLIFVILKKRALKKFVTGKELTYLKNRYHLDYNKINIKNLAQVVAVTNSFILATTVTILSLIKSMIIAMLMALFIIIPLIVLCYHVIGILFKKKERK